MITQESTEFNVKRLVGTFTESMVAKQIIDYYNVRKKVKHEQTSCPKLPNENFHARELTECKSCPIHYSETAYNQVHNLQQILGSVGG
jgi:ribosomal protein L37AE/L43A